MSIKKGTGLILYLLRFTNKMGTFSSNLAVWNTEDMVYKQKSEIMDQTGNSVKAI